MFEVSLCRRLRPEVRVGRCGSGWLAEIWVEAATAAALTFLEGMAVMGICLSVDDCV